MKKWQLRLRPAAVKSSTLQVMADNSCQSGGSTCPPQLALRSGTGCTQHQPALPAKANTVGSTQALLKIIHFRGWIKSELILFYVSL